ncbi:MAG: hypothetical protein RLP09_33630 [Sandaracinaceae bacterium]
MSEPAEDLDGAGLLLELLEEIRAQRAELRALREALGRREPKPAKTERRERRREPVEITDTDRAAARALARKLGMVVREPRDR